MVGNWKWNGWKMKIKMKWLENENEMVGKWNGRKKMKWLKLKMKWLENENEMVGKWKWNGWKMKMKWLENENERDGKWKCNGGENCKLWE